MTSSFSSISFEAVTAKRFKELSDKRDESHSETLRYLLDKLQYIQEEQGYDD